MGKWRLSATKHRDSEERMVKIFWKQLDLDGFFIYIAFKTLISVCFQGFMVHELYIKRNLWINL